MNRVTLLAPLLAGGAILTACTAGARAAEPALMPIEELVVTARKRSEPFLEVPTALTVLDAQRLADMGASRLQDAELRLPNMATNQSPLTGFTARYIRGVNAAARNIGFESGYGVFVDGVYGGRYAASNRVLQSVERIEFLPGPQATLFGKNTTLGVLNVVTRVPDPTPSADLSLDMGSQGRRGARLDAATGLGNDWVVWGSFGSEQMDGFDRNLATGRRGNDIDQQDALLALDGTRGEYRIRLTGDYFESRPELIARQRLEGFGALPPHRADNDLDGALEDEDRGSSLRVERDVALGTLTSISAYRAFDTTMSMDDDAWAIPVQHLVDWQESQRQLSQELRLAGDRGRVGYLAGVYYLDQETDLERNVASLFGTAQVVGELDTRSLAGFGNLEFDLSEALTAEAGLRWTKERKSLPRYTQDGGGVLIDFAEREQRSTTSLTPSSSLRYRISDRTTAWLRYARSFKSGGFNVDLVTAPAVTPLEFDDEQADTIEAGIKSALLNERLRLSAALFQTVYDDLQVSQYAVLPGAMLPTLRVTNAASATTVGGELGLELLLGPWELGTQIGYTHGEVDRFRDPLGPGTGDWSGNSLGGPDWTTGSRLQYGRTISRVGELTLAVEHLYQGALGGDLSDDPRTISDSLSLTNLSAALMFGRELRWTARFRVDNAFDTERVVERRQTAAPGLLMLLGFPPEIADSTVGLYNAPRTYGLELRFSL